MSAHEDALAARYRDNHPHMPERTVEPAQGDVRRAAARVLLDALADALPLNETGHVTPCGYDETGACTCSLLLTRLLDALTAAGLLAARPEAEIKAEALREYAEWWGSGPWLDSFIDGTVNDDVTAVQAMCKAMTDRATSIESEAGGRA